MSTNVNVKLVFGVFIDQETLPMIKERGCTHPVQATNFCSHCGSKMFNERKTEYYELELPEGIEVFTSSHDDGELVIGIELQQFDDPMTEGFVVEEIVYDKPNGKALLKFLKTLGLKRNLVPTMMLVMLAD